jgi:hypothetical protein
VIVREEKKNQEINSRGRKNIDSNKREKTDTKKREVEKQK